MATSTNILHSPKIWEITLEDFLKFGWGTAVNWFKLPKSIINRFRKDIQVTINNPDGTTTTQTKNVFDAETAFNEVAITYINAIVVMFSILRRHEWMEFEADTRQALKYAVYNAIEYSCLNRQLWENINESSISAPNFSIQANTVSWLITADMVGTKSWNWLIISGIEDYDDDFAEDVVYYTTRNKNTKYISRNLPLEERFTAK